MLEIVFVTVAFNNKTNYNIWTTATIESQREHISSRWCTKRDLPPLNFCRYYKQGIINISWVYVSRLRLFALDTCLLELLKFYNWGMCVANVAFQFSLFLEKKYGFKASIQTHKATKSDPSKINKGFLDPLTFLYF